MLLEWTPLIATSKSGRSDEHLSSPSSSFKWESQVNNYSEQRSTNGLYLLSILLTQPCDTCSRRLISQGRTPCRAIWSISTRRLSGNGRPLVNMRPYWFTALLPAAQTHRHDSAFRQGRRSIWDRGTRPPNIWTGGYYHECPRQYF